MPIVNQNLRLLPALRQFLAVVSAVQRLSQRRNHAALSGKQLLAERYSALAVLAQSQNPVALTAAQSVLAAVEKEICRRLERNFANRQFGLFLLAVKSSDAQLELESYKQLKQLGFGILNKVWPGYSWHPDHPDVWVECIGDVLLKEVQRHQSLQPVEIWERILDNRFAYLHIALKREFTDEWRNYYRHLGREVRMDEFHHVETAPVSAEERESIAKGFEEQAAKRENAEPGFSAVLRQYAAFERDPDGWEAMFGKFPRAVSRAVAQSRKVDIRTGQRDVKAAREKAQTDAELQALKERLKQAVTGPVLSHSADSKRTNVEED